LTTVGFLERATTPPFFQHIYFNAARRYVIKALKKINNFNKTRAHISLANKPNRHVCLFVNWVLKVLRQCKIGL
jgi:hypothetical protein